MTIKLDRDSESPIPEKTEIKQDIDEQMESVVEAAQHYPSELVQAHPLAFAAQNECSITAAFPKAAPRIWFLHGHDVLKVLPQHIEKIVHEAIEFSPECRPPFLVKRGGNESMKSQRASSWVAKQNQEELVHATFAVGKNLRFTLIRSKVSNTFNDGQEAFLLTPHKHERVEFEDRSTWTRSYFRIWKLEQSLDIPCDTAIEVVRLWKRQFIPKVLSAANSPTEGVKGRQKQTAMSSIPGSRRRSACRGRGYSESIADTASIETQFDVDGTESLVDSITSGLDSRDEQVCREPSFLRSALAALPELNCAGDDYTGYACDGTAYNGREQERDELDGAQLQNSPAKRRRLMTTETVSRDGIAFTQDRCLKDDRSSFTMDDGLTLSQDPIRASHADLRADRIRKSLLSELAYLSKPLRMLIVPDGVESIEDLMTKLRNQQQKAAAFDALMQSSGTSVNL